MARRRLTEEQAQELKRCKADPVYFVITYGYHRHSRKGAMKWDTPYDYQIELWEALHNEENVVVNKSRQIGCSWAAVAFAVWLMIFHPDVLIIMLSKKERFAKELIKKAKFFFRKLPAFLKPKILTNTQTEFSVEFKVIEDGEVHVAESSMLSLTTTTDSGRGFSAALVIMDEAAYLPNAEATWSAVLPTTVHGGQVLVVSTPNGVSNFFHRIVTQTMAGHETGFRFIKAYYGDCGYSKEWLKTVTVGMTIQQILQEFELQFVSAQSPFFDLNQLALVYKPPNEYPIIKAMMVKTAINFGGVDTSVGQNDYHSIIVLNENGIQIFAYHNNKLTAEEFAGRVILEGDTERYIEGVSTKIHREYPGRMGIESLGPGALTVSQHRCPEDTVSEMIPMWPSNTSKMRWLNCLRRMIAELAIVVTDHFTYACLQSFEDRSRGSIEKAEAAEGAFDDPVIGLAIAAYLLHRYGGATFDLRAVQGMAASNRMVGDKPGDDLSIRELDRVYSRIMPGPRLDGGQMSGETRLTDAVDERNVRPSWVHERPKHGEDVLFKGLRGPR